jgi:hypothetical protein
MRLLKAKLLKKKAMPYKKTPITQAFCCYPTQIMIESSEILLITNIAYLQKINLKKIIVMISEIGFENFIRDWKEI